MASFSFKCSQTRSPHSFSRVTKWASFASVFLSKCSFTGFSGLKLSEAGAEALARSLDSLAPRVAWVDGCQILTQPLATAFTILLRNAQRAALTGSDALLCRGACKGAKWESLLIENSGQLSGTFVKELAGGSTNLRVLQLPYCKLNPRNVGGICEGLSVLNDLKVLNLSGNQLGDDGCARVVNCVSNSLHCLVASGTGAGAVTLENVQGDRLIALDWSGNSCNGLSQTVRKMPCLIALDLRGCNDIRSLPSTMLRGLSHVGLSRSASVLLRRRARQLPATLQLWAPTRSPTPPQRARPDDEGGASQKEHGGKRPASSNLRDNRKKSKKYVEEENKENVQPTPMICTANVFPNLRIKKGFPIVMQGIAAACLRVTLAAPVGAGQSGLLTLLQLEPLSLLLALRLLLRSPSTAVSLADVATLEKLCPESANLRFLLQTALEELSLRYLTLKYQVHNQLDYDDRLDVPGAVLYDGGPGIRALSAAEFKLLWLRRHGVDFSRPLPTKESNRNLLEFLHPAQKGTDVCSTPSNDRSASQTPAPATDWGIPVDWFRELDNYVSLKRCPHAVAVVPSTQSPNWNASPSGLDLFSVDRNETSFAGGSEFIEDTATRLARASTPSASSICECRETLVVNVEGDSRLRKLVQQSQSLKASCQQLAERPSRDNTRKDPDAVLVEALQRFVLRKIHADSDNQVAKAAASGGGFVSLGDIKAGQSRHMALVFKVLCDALGIPCKLMRWVGDNSETAFNVALLPARRDALECARAVWWPRPTTLALHPVDAMLLRLMDDPSIDLADLFEFCQLLGKGSFGEVWRVRVRRRGNRGTADPPQLLRRWVLQKRANNASYDFALKLVDWEPSALTEAKFVQHYTHPRIVELLAVFRGFQILQNRQASAEKKQSLCLLMDLADTSFENALANHEELLRDAKPTNVEELRCLLLDTARAMAYLHRSSSAKPHILHRDLKPANILIKECNGLRRAFVTDFGLAYQFQTAEDAMTVGTGTEGYIAPEQYSRSYGRPADVWSFGVIVSRCLGVKNWRGLAERPLQRSELRIWDVGLARLCAACLQEDPLLRPTFKDIVDLLTDEILRFEFQQQVAIEVEKHEM